jgi:hypothetical protein
MTPAAERYGELVNDADPWGGGGPNAERRDADQ